MKKLKVALISALALCMSVGLVACGGSKKTIADIDLSSTTFSLTDADNEAAFQSKVLNELKITAKYEGRNVKDEVIKASDCTIDTQNIKWGTVGTYKVTVTPKKNNKKNVTTQFEVVIGHDFQNGVCSVDQATLTVTPINLDLNYEGFHEGITKLEYKETEAANQNAIRRFGNVTVRGREQEVKTATVGRLSKGMTITVKGTAIADFKDKVSEEKAYYFPIIGFADTSLGEYSEGVGTSVIVRHEGWVLLDGIGTPRLLAARAAGGLGGANDEGNYGSTEDARLTNEHPPVDYDKHGAGIPNVADWIDWYTYSEGDPSNTASYYEKQNIELTWTYRNDGVIELIYNRIDSYGDSYKLYCYTKVPDSDKGYYDTILHGEYVDMNFTEVSVIQTETLESVVYKGFVNDSAKKVYVENEYLDFNTLSVVKTTKQNPNEHPDRQFDVEAKVGEDWVSLTTHPLSSAMTQFRISLTIGTVTKTADIPSEGFIKIVANAVDSAYSHDVTVDGVAFKNNSTLGQLAFSTEINGEDSTPVLSLAGRANSLTAAQKTKLGTTADKYVAFRIWARDEGRKFTAGATATVKSGANTLADAHVTVTENYVDVVLPVTDAIKTAGVLIEGIVTDGASVKIDLSEVECLETVSSITMGNLTLNEGGKVTVVYTLAEATYSSMNFVRSQITVNGSNLLFNSLNEGKGTVSGIPVTVTKNDDAHTVTAEFDIPAFSVTDVRKFDITFAANDGRAPVVQATDTIYYDMSFGSGESNGQIVSKDNNVYVEANGTTLYVVWAKESSDLTSGQIISDDIMLNVNDGTLESLHYYNLAFKYEDGEFVFDSQLPKELVTAKLTAFGTLDNSLDSDYGCVVVLTVDLTKLDKTAAPYFFEINANEEVEYILRATAENKVEKVSTTGKLGGEVAISEGSCLEEGMVVREYKEEDKVAFLAGVKKIGGEHHFEGDTCTLCGAKLSTLAISTGENSGRTVLHSGEYIRITGTYGDKIMQQPFNGIEARVILDNGTWVRMRNDGYYALETNNGGATLLYNSNEFNTLNGVLNLIDGTAIDATTTSPVVSDEECISVARMGATFEVTITFVDGVATAYFTITRKNETTPWAAFTMKVSAPDETQITTGFRLDNYNGSNAEIVGNQVTKVVGKVANSDIASIVDVNAKTTIQENGLYVIHGDAGAKDVAYVKLNATGSAAKMMEGVKTELEIAAADEAAYAYYTQFTMNLNHALPESSIVSVKTLDGVAAKYAKVTLNPERTAVTVTIALDGAAKAFLIDFVNLEANTIQSDVVLDVSTLAVSELASAVENNANVLGGTVKITYTGTIPADAQFRLNGESVAWAELNGHTFANGDSAAVAEQVITLTLDKQNLEAEIPTYVAELLSASGAVIAYDEFEVLAMPEDQDLLYGAYLLADGAKLYVITSGNEGGSGITVNVNGGANTTAANEILTKVQNYDITFSVNKRGEVVFANSNNLTANAFGVCSGDEITVLTFDLTDLGVEDGTVYYFQMIQGSEGEILAAKVDGDRKITKVELNHDVQQTTVNGEACVSAGVKYRTLTENDTAVFYYDVEVATAHNWVADGTIYKCETCGAYLAPGEARATAIPASAFGEEKINSESGMTVSFLLNSARSTGNADWDNLAVQTVYGHVNLTLPNLQTNVMTDVSDDDTISALHTKLMEKDNGRDVYSNVFPSSAGASLESGYAWNSIIGATNAYITVTISKANGVVFYMNGNKVVTYPADMAFGIKEGTVADFVEMFMLCAVKQGVVVATSQGGGTIAAEDVLVQKGAMSADEAKAAYELYRIENSAYPAQHEHVFAPATDRCACGLFNPNHGNQEKGGQPHDYDETTGICKFEGCDKENPDKHTHDYTNNGVCSCHETCAHETLNAQNVCAACGATVTSLTVDDKQTYWPDTASKIVYTPVQIGATTVFTMQYTEFTPGAYSGAMFVVKFGGSKYAFRYVDGAFVGAAGGNGWNNAFEGQTVNVAATGTDMAFNDDGSTAARLPGIYTKVTVTHLNGTLTIRIEEFAKDDAKLTTVTQTRVIVVTGMNQPVEFGFSHDGTAFVNDKVTKAVYASKTTCETHNWSNGVCLACGTVCEHESYNATTQKCETCGILHPEHGTNTTYPHVDENGDSKCDICGETMEHTHSWVNGVCSVCQEVCKHETVTDNVCATCHGTFNKKEETHDNITATSTGWNSTLFKDFIVKQGEIGRVYGTQTKTLTEGDSHQWNSINFEFDEGYTMRPDNYGWAFGAEKFASVIGAPKLTNKSQEEVNIDWAIVCAIENDCTWEVTVDYTTATPVVTAKFVANSGTYEGYTYVIVYTCTWKDTVTERASVNFRLGPCGSTKGVPNDLELTTESVTATVTKSSIESWTWETDVT